MNKGNEKDEQGWKLLVLLLKEVAIEKHGHGWQKFLEENTPFHQSNISRMFGLKYCPTLQNFIIIAKALKMNFFLEDQESKTELNVLFEKAMDQLGRRPEKLPKN